ncbi:LysR substrate-binding domain-containing protein [Paenibacillus sp. P96]|uniref:LysR substrate-binding domain-containing protein n=1 Tax=Paenibacillus zeirhizosphaerae TaxID=2987519 RepID=A0ABT9FKT8_9BACL|nr:LysR substrate-binding domain-containing protein [Paenibacillus sp. P96]MDP4095343.1 LysR substrate-binding domain-containing protein [Paenibacillus sp. P96]
MSLFKYEILLKVIETGSLTKAAEQLNLTQSAVSHAVASLEGELGLQLLHRGRSGVRLTHEGERLWGYMQEMVHLQGRLQQEADLIKGLETGMVTIGTFTSVSMHWLPDIIKNFQDQYPLIHIKLLDGDYQEIESWIARGTVDFGFVNLPTVQGLEQIELKQDKLLCIIPSGHRLSEEECITTDHISEEPFIMPAKGCDTDVRKWFSEQGGTPRVRFELEDDHAIIAMVRSGLGISILPETILSDRPSGLYVCPLAPEAHRTIGLAALSFKKGSPAAAKAIAFIIEAFRSEAGKIPFHNAAAQHLTHPGST